jgi:hypothetical protein
MKGKLNFTEQPPMSSSVWKIAKACQRLAELAAAWCSTAIVIMYYLGLARMALFLTLQS